VIPLERLDEIVKKNITEIIKSNNELLKIAMILDQKIKADKLKTEEVFKLKDINDQIISNFKFKSFI